MLVPFNGKECSLACSCCTSFGSTRAAPTQYREGYSLVEHHRQLLHITQHQTLERTFEGNEGLGHLLVYFRQPF